MSRNKPGSISKIERLAIQNRKMDLALKNAIQIITVLVQRNQGIPVVLSVEEMASVNHLELQRKTLQDGSMMFTVGPQTAVLPSEPVIVPPVHQPSLAEELAERKKKRRQVQEHPAEPLADTAPSLETAGESGGSLG